MLNLGYHFFRFLFLLPLLQSFTYLWPFSQVSTILIASFSFLLLLHSNHNHHPCQNLSRWIHSSFLFSFLLPLFSLPHYLNDRHHYLALHYYLPHIIYLFLWLWQQTWYFSYQLVDLRYFSYYGSYHQYEILLSWKVLI